MKKRKQKKEHIPLITGIIVLTVVLLSIGWSSYNSIMTLDSVAIVRASEDVRVTGFSIYQANNNALGTYEEYGVNFVTGDVTLPNANSTITYEVEVTNIQLPNGMGTGILDIYGLPEELSVLSWSGYTLKDKICDTIDPTDCGPGSQMTFYITIGYTDATYFDNNDTNLSFELYFDFRQFHDITYNNISGNYPLEVLDGDSLTLTLSNVSSLELQVSGANDYVEGTDYTYSNNVLTIGSVYEDLNITKLSSFTITYDANGGYFDGNSSITTNAVTYLWRNNQNVILSGTEKTPANGTSTLYNWYTDNQNYTTVFDKTVRINQNATVYAKWVDKIAELNGQLYDSLDAAIKAVNTSNQVTIRLLKNTSDNISIASTRNIIIDMQNHTLNNKNNGAVITNDGTLKLINGTINSTSTQNGVINNTGSLTLENTNVNMTASGGKQAIYSSGTIEIKGTSHLTSVSGSRATVQLTAGSLTVTGGTIEALGSKSAIISEGSVTIGTKDGNVTVDDITIKGENYGIEGTFSFYDGVIKGKTDAIPDEDNIIDTEPNQEIFNSQEVINDKTYYGIRLAASHTVTFIPNGGDMTTGTTRYVTDGMPVGTLPPTSRSGYILVGWFTEASGGTQIDANYIITKDERFYAQWTRAYSAEMNGTYYYAVQDAIDAAPNNTRTTVTVLRDAGESANITNTKNIYLNLNSHTLSYNGANAVLECYGVLEVTNGTITTESNSNSAINIRPNGNAIIDSVNIISTGSRQAVYNYGTGTALIKGNAYISSKTTGKPSGSNMERATVQNLANSTLTITGGTIIGINQQAISNEGTLTIGIKDGNIDNTNIIVRGKTYGLKSSVSFNWYDGIMKGINDGINGTIGDQEPNATIMSGAEIVDNNTYITKYQQAQ